MRFNPETATARIQRINEDRFTKYNTIIPPGPQILYNIGCGHHEFIAHDCFQWVNHDYVKRASVNHVFDIQEPWPLKTKSISGILMQHVLEHTWEPVQVLNEAWRVLKPGGIAIITVPHYKDMTAWSDLTHRRAFTPKSLNTMTDKTRYRGRVSKNPSQEWWLGYSWYNLYQLNRAWMRYRFAGGHLWHWFRNISRISPEEITWILSPMK